jgi:hypothetical protein
MNCALSFRGTDGLMHICDIKTGIDHKGVHFCEAHNVYSIDPSNPQGVDSD